jgi:hypothetical protein
MEAMPRLSQRGYPALSHIDTTWLKSGNSKLNSVGSRPTVDPGRIHNEFGQTSFKINKSIKINLL